MKLAFFGSPEFAVPSAQGLIDAGYEIVVVACQPDRPAGRGRRPRPPAMKVWAEGQGIPVMQPRSIRAPRAIERLTSLSPHAIIVVAYGQILPPAVLSIPRLGCINVHASLLPELRGAAPIQWALIRGHRRTGVTTMMMDEGMDTGAILLQSEYPITEDDDAGTLHDRLSQSGAELLPKTLRGLDEGTLAPVSQDHERASYAPLIEASDRDLDPRDAALAIRNRVRAFSPSPGTQLTFRQQLLKVLRVELAEGGGEPGAIIATPADRGPVLACGDGAIELVTLQPAGKRRMAGEEFVRGYRPRLGERMERIRRDTAAN